MPKSVFGTEVKPKKKTRAQVLLSHFLANQAVPARAPDDPEVTCEVAKWAAMFGFSGDFDVSEIPVEQTPTTFQRLHTASGIALGWIKAS